MINSINVEILITDAMPYDYSRDEFLATCAEKIKDEEHVFIHGQNDEYTNGVYKKTERACLHSDQTIGVFQGTDIASVGDVFVDVTTNHSYIFDGMMWHECDEMSDSVTEEQMELDLDYSVSYFHKHGQDNGWNHYVINYDDKQVSQIFINGEEVVSHENDGLWFPPQSLHMGPVDLIGQDYTITEQYVELLRIFERLLDSDQAKELFVDDRQQQNKMHIVSAAEEMLK